MANSSGSGGGGGGSGTNGGSGLSGSTPANASAGFVQSSGGGGGASFGSSSSDISQGVSSLGTTVAHASVLGTLAISGIDNVLDDQYELTKRYLYQFETDYAFWESRYAPMLRAVAEEFFGTAPGAGDGELKAFEQFSNRRGVSSMKARRQTDASWLQTYNNLSPYHVGAQRWSAVDSSELAFVASTGLDDWALRFEMAYAEAHNIRRWNHRLQIANVGVEGGNMANAGLSSAIQEAGAARDGIVNQRQALGAGFAKAASYAAERYENRNKE